MTIPICPPTSRVAAILVLVALAVRVEAQECLGLPSLQSARAHVSASFIKTTGDGALPGDTRMGLVGGLAAGPAFATLGALRRTSPDGLFAATSLGLKLGNYRHSLCPFASYSLGIYQLESDYSFRATEIEGGLAYALMLYLGETLLMPHLSVGLAGGDFRSGTFSGTSDPQMTRSVGLLWQSAQRFSLGATARSYERSPAVEVRVNFGVALGNR